MMSLINDPIFKSIMFALAVVYVALVSQSVFAAKGWNKPPEPVIAEDVDCIGCFDTVDIADGGDSVAYPRNLLTGNCSYWVDIFRF